MKHENNMVIVSAKKGFTFYTDLDINNHNVTNPSNPERPWVFISCELFHRVVSLDQEEVLHEEHVLLAEFCSNTDNIATADQSRCSIENVLSRTRIPFDLDGRGCRLLWKERVRMDFDEAATVELCHWDEVVDRVSEVAERIAGEVTSAERPVTSVEMKISFSKVTFVEDEDFVNFNKNESYISFADEDDDENVLILGDEFSRWSSMDYDDNDIYNNVAMAESNDDNDDNNNKMGFLFETVVYGGAATELRCAICRDEVEVGTHVAILPCAHMFHGDCIDPWVKKKTTCPNCRFDLVKQ